MAGCRGRGVWYFEGTVLVRENQINIIFKQVTGGGALAPPEIGLLEVIDAQWQEFKMYF